MRRTVTLEIDTARFSEAFRGLSGEEAKEVLVMLVCGGHAVASHSACLVDVGIKPALPPCDPSAEQAECDAKVARAARDFIKAIGPFRHSDVFSALEDRPKPGSKAKARDSMKLLLGCVYDLRKGIEFSRSFRLEGSTARHEEDAGSERTSPHA